MSLTGREQHLLDTIGTGLARSDPGLERLMWTFGQLTADEQMPAREQVSNHWRRLASSHRRRRRLRRRPQAGRDPLGGRLHIGIGAVLVLIWALVGAVLVALAVGLGGGHETCRNLSIAGCPPAHSGSSPEPGFGSLPEPGRVGNNGGPAMRLAVQAQAPALLMASTT